MNTSPVFVTSVTQLRVSRQLPRSRLLRSLFITQVEVERNTPLCTSQQVMKSVWLSACPLSPQPKPFLSSVAGSSTSSQVSSVLCVQLEAAEADLFRIWVDFLK